MRTKVLVLMSMLALTPAVARAQRIEDCWSRYSRCGSRLHERSYDAEIARAARQAASRARAETQRIANRVRSESRAYATAARAEARAWERRERAIPMARIRAEELRTRLRDRIESRVYDRRPNYRRW